MPLHRPWYSLNEWGPSIQDWFNRNYPDQPIFIKCFDAASTKREHIYPKAGTPLPSPDARTLVITHSKERQHFYPLRSMVQFFGYDYYCHGCMKTYNDPIHHGYKCPITCIKCRRPTKAACERADDGYEQMCNGHEFNSYGCNVVFTNKACFLHHRKRVCNRDFYCHKCRLMDANDGKHECFKHRCNHCHVRHFPGRRHCYITPLKEAECPENQAFEGADSECWLCGPGACNGDCMLSEKCPLELDELREKILGIRA